MACSSSCSLPSGTLDATSLTRATSPVRISPPVTDTTPVEVCPATCSPPMPQYTVPTSTPAIRSASFIAFWMARVVSSIPRTTPRRTPAQRSNPTPSMRVRGDALVALDLGDDGGDLGSAEIERRDQPGGRRRSRGLRRTTICPAKRASSSAQWRPLRSRSCSTDSTARITSAPAIRPEPVALSINCHDHVAPAPPGRNDAGIVRGISRPNASEESRHQRIGLTHDRQIRRPETVGSKGSTSPRSLTSP